MNEELKVIITAEIADLQKKVDSATKQIEDFSKKGSSGASNFSKAMGGAAKAAGAGMMAAGAAVVGVAAALGGLAESTREYRTEQAKLTTAFVTAGSNANVAKDTYNDLFRVLGDSGQATEAAQHLAKLTTEEKALSEWTDICQGVYATFGDSLPIESLTEAVNHSAQLGEVQGSLADALEWSGVNVDEFNDQLFLCNTESERERLIRNTLNGLYKDAAAGYEENAASVLAANEAQSALNDALAAMGGAIEPLMTVLKGGFASILQELIPSIDLFSEGLLEMVSGVEGGTEKMKEGFSQIVEAAADLLLDIVDKITEFAPVLLDLLVDLIPKLTGTILDALPDILNAVLKILAEVINALAEILPEILKQIADSLPKIIKVLIDNVPTLLKAAITLFNALVSALGDIIPVLLDALPELITALIDGLVDSVGVIADGAEEMFGGIIDAIFKIIPSILNNLPKIISSIVSGLVKAAPQLLKAGVTMLGGLLSAFGQIPGKIGSYLSNIVTTVKNNLVEKLKSLLKFNWSLPKLKMPSITVTWKNSPKALAEAAKILGLEGVPSFGVKWNAKGGVFDKPTLFNYGGSLQGIGEAGAEAVVPLENNLGWLDKLAGMLSARIGDTPVVLQVDRKTLAKTTIGAINELTRQQGKLSLNMV